MANNWGTVAPEAGLLRTENDHDGAVTVFPFCGFTAKGKLATNKKPSLEELSTNCLTDIPTSVCSDIVLHLFSAPQSRGEREIGDPFFWRDSTSSP